MSLRRVLAALALLAGSLVVVSAHAAGETPPAPRRIVSLKMFQRCWSAMLFGCTRV